MAQEPVSAKAPGTTLRIVILEGEGAINVIKQRVNREAVVQVVDENNQPVSGAMVVFTLPDTGPGGIFANGSRTLLAHTNSAGKAAAMGFKANSAVGKFQLMISASHKGVATTATVTQTNAVTAAAAGGTAAGTATAAAAGISKTLIAVIAIAGAAAAGGAVAASGGNGGSTPSTGSGTQNPAQATIVGPGTPKFEKPH
jgi:hypothetical protein